MNRIVVIIVAILILLIGGFYVLNNYIYQQKQGDPMTTTKSEDTTTTKFSVKPISHASMILTFGGQTIYNDPVGGADAYMGNTSPSLILISDIHGDHLDPETLTAISKEDTTLIVSQAVSDMLPKDLVGTVVVLGNGEKTTQKGIEIEAIPMYNMPESASSAHTKGRGNGYVLSAGGQRIYIAGDTGATPEMMALQNIDVAFVPMNLPYTMSVTDADRGVLGFKPKLVHPYHYRGPEGLADINKFKQLVEAGNQNITVEILNFYPGS